MNYQTRLRRWADIGTNVAQKEFDGATLYFFGNSFVRAKTLSGTHADKEQKPARRAKDSSTVTVNVDINTDAINAKIKELATAFGDTGNILSAVARAMQEFGREAQRVFGTKA